MIPERILRARRAAPPCAAALLLATACASPSTPGTADAPNVVLISIDSLRPDHLGAYGYERGGTSPRIDAVAAEGVVFENAVSTTTWTLPAHASMLTGLYPEIHGARGDDDRVPEAAVLVSEAFHEAGYATRAVIAAPYLNRAFGFDQGWDLYDDATGVFESRSDNLDDSHWGTTSPEVHRRAVEALDAVGTAEDPFFLFVHYWDVHYDYAPPPPYDTMFDPDYEGSVDSLNFYWNDDIHPGMSRRDLDHLVALYDGEIAYTDAWIGRLFDELRRRDLWRDTLLVITADHGDEFFEHGEKGHERNLFGTTLDVPLIVKLPGGDHAGRRVADFASLVDVPATLLDVAGVSLPPMQGQSLQALLTGEATSRPLFAALGGDTAIIDEGHKLISEPNSHNDRVRRSLFNLIEDPAEVHDLARTLRDRRRSMIEKQRQWSELAQQARLPAQGVQNIDPALLERLRSLGYLR